MASDALLADGQLRAARTAYDAATTTIAARDAEIATLRAIIADRDAALQGALERAQEDETLRWVLQP